MNPKQASHSMSNEMVSVWVEYADLMLRLKAASNIYWAL